MNINELNIDCLLYICHYLCERDLVNLAWASSYLRDVIELNIFYNKSMDVLMCGHRNRPHIMERTHTPLSYWNRLAVSRNWNDGSYFETQYFAHSQMFPTKMHLQRDCLYITHTRYLRKFRRSAQEALNRRMDLEIIMASRSDIVDFVKKGETLFAGRTCGSCFVYDTELGLRTEQQLHSPKDYMYCVDFAGEIYATSTNTCGKLWRRSDEFGLVHLDLLKDLKQSYKSLKVSHSGELVFGGQYTDVARCALREFNVETGDESILNSDTISIYDIKLKDDHVLFTANFDATLRMFDRRTNRDERVWDDPFNASLYCLDYDGLYAVLCGTNYYSRVNLFDIRMAKTYAQLYFPKRGRNRSSPVYSIACDSRYLFVGTDHSLRVLDFKVDCSHPRDHRNLFSEMHIC